MALTYGFYNSQDGDRKYDAVQMSSIFDGIIEDGIFQSIGTAMAVTASTGKTVVVGVGRAWFDHTWTLNDSGHPIELPESEVLLDRIDAVVLEVDASVAVRANSFKVVEGAPASNPQRPSLVNNETTHQHALAYILRKAGTEEVTQADITNVIGTSETPYVTGPLSIITADAMLAQWQSEFDQWFESLEDTLSGDVAANLANQIMQKVDKTSVIDNLDEIAATTEEGYVAGALAVKDLNSKISQSQQGKFVIPGGLKIFWGEGQTSASPDEAGVCYATVPFPEPFSDTNYLFICQRWVSHAHTYKENNVYAYLGNEVGAAHAGSPKPNQPFRWVAIGY